MLPSFKEGEFWQIEGLPHPNSTVFLTPLLPSHVYLPHCNLSDLSDERPAGRAIPGTRHVNTEAFRWPHDRPQPPSVHKKMRTPSWIRQPKESWEVVKLFKTQSFRLIITPSLTTRTISELVYRPWIIIVSVFLFPTKQSRPRAMYCSPLNLIM